MELMDRAGELGLASPSGYCWYNPRGQWLRSAPLLLIVLGLAASSQSVVAQEERGHHLSRRWVLPSVEVGGFYDSNPNASSNQEDGSFGAYVASNIEAKSDFSRHAI